MYGVTFTTHKVGSISTVTLNPGIQEPGRPFYDRDFSPNKARVPKFELQGHILVPSDDYETLDTRTKVTYATPTQKGDERKEQTKTMGDIVSELWDQGRLPVVNHQTPSTDPEILRLYSLRRQGEVDDIGQVTDEIGKLWGILYSFTA